MTDHILQGPPVQLSRRNLMEALLLALPQTKITQHIINLVRTQVAKIRQTYSLSESEETSSSKSRRDKVARSVGGSASTAKEPEAKSSRVAGTVAQAVEQLSLESEGRAAKASDANEVRSDGNRFGNRKSLSTSFTSWVGNGKSLHKLHKLGKKLMESLSTSFTSGI
ncbi:hypothetical protein COCNU_12G005060 [Cocos nucifera]|uniref:Uncharacterized protein n=1 Tax=Cocos nucifera TaxID=13894 RepID=A0A8K0IRZ7_COCNU|nr:hypothetical protein COCNU_12G005060 [Cocos nucifera]